MKSARSVRPLTASIHAASAPHVGLPARELYGEVFRRNTILITPYKVSAAIWGTGYARGACRGAGSPCQDDDPSRRERECVPSGI